MSICKNFEVCETRYIFLKPYENHKNHHNLLLKHFFTNLVLRIVGLDETFHLLENYWKTQKYIKLDTKKPKIINIPFLR